MAMLTAISMIVFLIEAQIPLPIAIPGVETGGGQRDHPLCHLDPGPAGGRGHPADTDRPGKLDRRQRDGHALQPGGGLLCWVIMCLMKPITSRKHIWVMSIFGAMGHNVGQLAVAIFRLRHGVHCHLCPGAVPGGDCHRLFHRPVRPGRAEPYGQAAQVWLIVTRKANFG